MLLREPLNNESIETLYDIFTEDVKVIENDGKVVGYIEFIISDSENIRKLNIDMIEIIDKNNGLGRQVIKWLFKEYNLLEMNGSILIDWDLNAYNFWKHLGSIIDVNEEDAIEYVEANFILYKDEII